MKNVWRLLFTLPSAALASCTMALTVQFQNNTLETIVLHYSAGINDMREVAIAPGAMKEIKDWQFETEARIQAGATSHCYTASYAPAKYDDIVGWFIFVKRIAKARLEPDGRITLLMPDQGFNDPAPEQPKGFPLAPSHCKV